MDVDGDVGDSQYREIDTEAIFKTIKMWYLFHSRMNEISKSYVYHVIKFIGSNMVMRYNILL